MCVFLRQLQNAEISPKCRKNPEIWPKYVQIPNVKKNRLQIWALEHRHTDDRRCTKNPFWDSRDLKKDKT